MKRLASLILAIAMLLTLAPMSVLAAEDAASMFSDVKTSDYYAQAAAELAEAGILTGYPDGTFGAEKSITRAEMAAIVCRMIEMEDEAEASERETNFDDVSTNHWASGYISVASDEGIINGDGDGKFRPEDDVKFEEAIKMVVCALGLGGDVEVDPEDWSAGYLEVAEEEGISDNLKGSKGKAATRGDVAVMTFNGIAPETTDSVAVTSVAAPEASLAAGLYKGTQNVVLTTDTEGAEIYYTINGSTPTTSSTKYGKYVSVADNCTLKAIAVKDGVSSSVMSVAYTISRSGGGKSAKSVSRGEWVKKLVDAYGYPQAGDVGELSYTDIEDNKYKKAIETAVIYGVLKPDGNEEFNPSAAATREFAAETAVYSLGYEPNGSIVCEDAAEIDNAAAAKYAVELELLSLENNHFYPERKLSAAEANTIISGVETIFNSVNGAQDGTGFTYLDNVIVVSDDSGWVDSNNEMTVPEGFSVPDVGSIIVFGTEKAVKVESVTQTEEQTKITYSKPELYEFLDSINTAGEAFLDFSQFVPAEGVTVTSNSSQGIQMFGFADDAFDVPNTDLNVNAEVELGGKIDLGDNWAIGYGMTLNVPSVSYKFDIDFDANPFNDEPFVNVKNAYVKMKEEMDVHFELGQGIDTGDDSFDDSVFDDILEKEIQLGTVPLVGVDGLCVEIELDLVLTASGRFEMDYTVLGTLGCQVLNNQLRNISTLNSSCSFGLAADVSAGPKIGLEAEVFGEDLVDFAFEAGGKAGGSAHIRSTGMVCMDASAYVYAKLSAFEYSLIDEWLEIGMTFNIWDDDNSPVKISGHWEDLQKVSECTFNETGTINGTVANADNRTQYIRGAMINVLEHATLDTMETAYSDAEGKYSVTVPANSYLVQISADGYIPFESLETVGANENIYLETYLLVEGDENSDETGTIGGTVKNTVTGSGVPGVKLTVRKGWNNTTGETVTTGYTDPTGNYSFTLPLGNYTINMECDGYLTNHFNVAVTRNGNMNAHAALSPDNESEVGAGDVRIVLTWGATPYDLDSHLVGPTADGDGRFHTYYSNKSYYSNGNKYADLDLDDITSYGPETTTIYIKNDTGKYRYYVHDFSNRNSMSSTAMSNSGAKVQVYSQDSLIATYHVPTNTVGTLWGVFEYDSETGIISALNTMTNHTDTGSVGMFSLFGLDAAETVGAASNDDRDIIFADIEEAEKD